MHINNLQNSNINKLEHSTIPSEHHNHKKKSLAVRVWAAFCRFIKNACHWIKGLFQKKISKPVQTLPAFVPPKIEPTTDNCAPYQKLTLDQSYQKKIHYVFDNLSKNLLHINWHIKEIEKQYTDVITNVHPLKLLEFVFSNKSTELKKINEGPGVVWGKLLKKIYTALQQQEGTIAHYLPGFAKSLNIDESKLKNMVDSKESWKTFTQELIEWKIGKKTLDLGNYQSKIKTTTEPVKPTPKQPPSPATSILNNYLTSYYQTLGTNNTEKLWNALKGKTSGKELLGEFSKNMGPLKQLLGLQGYWGMPSPSKYVFLFDLERHYPIQEQNLETADWQTELKKIL